MMNITSDDIKIYVTYTDLKTFPYGTGQLVYAINELSIDTSSELIRFNNDSGGELFYVWIDELYFSGEKATMSNVDDLFKKTCFSCCGGGEGGTITGDINFDSTEIVKALKEINKTLQENNCCNGGNNDNCDCCDDIWFEEYLKKEEFDCTVTDLKTKYMIYDEVSGGCCDKIWLETYISKLESEGIEYDVNKKYMIYVEDDEPTPQLPIYSSVTQVVSECYGFNLMSNTYKQDYVSYDSGKNWELFKQNLLSSSLIKSECAECGYMPQINCETITYDNNGVKNGIFELQEIPEMKFYRNNTIARIDIGSCVQKINFFSLSEMNNLKTVNLTEGLIELIEHGICENPLLETLYLPDSLQIIGDYCFHQDGLKSVRIGHNVRKIGKGIFNVCFSLTDINYDGTISEWNSIEKDADWKGHTHDVTLNCKDGKITL